MNLAFISKRYDTIGGTETDLYELARRLAQRGHQIHIYCYEQRRDPSEGVSVHLVPAPGVGRTAKLQGLATRGVDMAYRGGHDLVVSYARVPRQDIIRCGGGTHRGYLDRMRGVQSYVKRLLRQSDPYHRAVLQIERRQFTLPNYAHVLAISRVVKDDVQKTYGVPDQRIEVIYDGVDTERFCPEPGDTDRREVRSRFDIPDDAPVLLFVGNAFKRKGLDTALSALRRTRDRNIRLLVVGTDPQRPRYESLARNLGVGEAVCFAGVQSNTVPFYRAADALVLPSRHEAFGNVALEALACGIPAVVSRCSGAAEVLTGPLAEHVVDDADDDRALATAAERILDDRDRTVLSREARATAERYTFEQHTQATEAFFQRVHDEKQRRSMSGRSA